MLLFLLKRNINRLSVNNFKNFHLVFLTKLIADVGVSVGVGVGIENPMGVGIGVVENLICDMILILNMGEKEVIKTVGGRNLTISRRDIEEALERIKPEPLKGRAKYYIEHKGIKFPIKQVIAEATRLPRVAFTARDAYDILTKLGFEVKEK